MTTRRANQMLSLLIIAFGVYIYVVASSLPVKSAQMPQLITWVLVILGLVMLGFNTIVKPTEDMLRVKPFADGRWGMWCLVSGLLVLYGLFVADVGFYEMSVAFVLVVSFALSWAEDKPVHVKALQALVYALLFTVGVYFIFEDLLHVPTPHGLLI